MEGHRFLSLDADDFDAHLALLLAYSQSNRLPEAKPHLDCLLRNLPEESSVLAGAAHYYQKSGNWRKVITFANQGLSVDADDCRFHYYLSVAAAARYEVKKARRHIQRARELSPHDADYAHFEVALTHAVDSSVKGGLQEIESYQEALQLEPENPDLHHSIGVVYLEQLHKPREAEGFIREALRLDPQDERFQKSLFRAVAERDPVYRVFSLPGRAFETVQATLVLLTKQPWRLLLLLVGFKFVLAYFFWLFLVAIFFWPGGRVYEYLLVAEFPSPKKSSLKRLQDWNRFQAIPRSLRFLAFVLLNLALWLGLFWWIGLSWKIGLGFIAILWFFHFIMLGVLSFTKKLELKRQLKRAERSKKKALRRGTRGESRNR